MRPLLAALALAVVAGTGWAFLLGCSSPAAKGAPPPPPPPPTLVGTAAPPPPQAQAGSGWTCGNCTTDNPASAKTCFSCGQRR